jgi:hypothetical protein
MFLLLNKESNNHLILTLYLLRLLNIFMNEIVNKYVAKYAELVIPWVLTRGKNNFYNYWDFNSK